MSRYELPGRRLKHCVVSPESVRALGVSGAWEEVERRIRAEFVEAVRRAHDGGATFHVAITVEGREE
jgi:hypothetical protein